MHSHDLSPWQHLHDFAPDRSHAARRTHWVIAITLLTMLAEIAAGSYWHSMALLADGWHMGTHAAAIGVAALSYALARRWAADARFSLGPWKVEVLGAYTSAVLLGVVALYVALESALRLWSPRAVAYDESLWVAAVGLLVNALCAWLLHAGHGDERGHSHGHSHAHAHAHSHEHASAPSPQTQGAPARASHGRDLNLQAAYVHVLADAATSVLAIVALLAGKLAGWVWLDAIVGLLGAALIASWAVGLVRSSAKILLDREMDDPLADEVRARLQADGDARVADLHLWRVGDAQFACQATVVADQPLAADAYRARLHDLRGLVHVLIEVNRCRGATHMR